MGGGFSQNTETAGKLCIRKKFSAVSKKISITFPKRETGFLVRRGQMLRSAKKYGWAVLNVLPIRIVFVSGSRCAPYHNKTTLRFHQQSIPLHLPCQ
jgi:hypothetical protein